MNYRLAVNAFFFFNGFLFANWAARLPYLQELHAIGHQQLSYILLSHSIGAFIAMPVTGWMIGKYSSKAVTRWAGIVFPICFMCVAFMPDYWTLFIPFFFMGMSSGIMDVAMNAQAVDVEKSYNKPIMTSFHAAFSIGMMIGGLSAGLFLTVGSSIGFHFTAVGGLTFIMMFFAARFLYPDVQDQSEGNPLFAIPKGVLIGLGIIAFCCMMGEGAISDWSTNYMKRIVMAEVEVQTLGLTGFAAMMAIGRLFGDKGRAVMGDPFMLVTGAVISLLGMGLVLSLLGPMVTIIGFALVGLGLANIIPIAFSIAGDTPGVKPGVGIAMTSTIGYSGFMFGPPIIGLISDYYNLWVGLGVIMVLFIIMTVLVISYSHKASRN